MHRHLGSDLGKIDSQQAQALDERILDLWEQRFKLRERFARAFQARVEAEARLPEWVLPGPLYLESDGTFSGPISWAPAIQGLRPPAQGCAAQLSRPYKREIELEYDLCVSWNVPAAGAIRQEARNALAARLRAARSEKRRVGWFAAERGVNALYEESMDIEGMIEALPPAKPNVVAAQMLLEAISDCDPSYGFDREGSFRVAFKALRFLRPALTGILRQHVDEVLGDPSRRISDSSIYLFCADYTGAEANRPVLEADLVDASD